MVKESKIPRDSIINGIKWKQSHSGDFTRPCQYNWFDDMQVHGTTSNQPLRLLNQ